MNPKLSKKQRRGGPEDRRAVALGGGYRPGALDEHRRPRSSGNDKNVCTSGAEFRARPACGATEFDRRLIKTARTETEVCGMADENAEVPWRCSGVSRAPGETSRSGYTRIDEVCLRSEQRLRQRNPKRDTGFADRSSVRNRPIALQRVSAR